ncbi:c-type cytochrome [Undibacterium sp. SXout7W]|uniref:c-type cytochrome n=1 Tax=Undibacterium sp. SXout7W TaxID=3413049 RepID=UPI003BF1D085
MKKILRYLVSVFVLLILAVGLYGQWLLDDHQYDGNKITNIAVDASILEQGAYLVRAGNCMGCHTQRGGAAYAGGRIIRSEFGDFVSPNITPDIKTGIGRWTSEDFWQALHNGKSPDGKLLYPAFPYPNYTQVTRQDADRMFAYLKTLTPVSQENQNHHLHFPYDQRALLAFWRAAYFRPGVFQEQSEQRAMWNRGAYLVNGLGHCSACHSSRNALGANAGYQDLSGGELAMVNWYAPSLSQKNEAHLLQWTSTQSQSLLQNGISGIASVSGPMAEVVAESLQYLSVSDIAAITSYLQSIPVPQQAPEDMLDRSLSSQAIGKETMDRIMLQGSALYKTHCSDCHGAGGDGVASVYPALKGNYAVQSHSVTNPVRMVLAGGFPPSTRGNPRPYGMPPFGPMLTDSEVAVVLTYIRNAWGNQGSVITSAEVNRYRTSPLD